MTTDLLRPNYCFSTSEECPRQDSNLYAVSDTGPSNQPVYQFQHVGKSLAKAGISLSHHQKDGPNDARGGTRTLTGLPPQDPESCASTNSATRAPEDSSGVEPRGIEPLTS